MRNSMSHEEKNSASTQEEYTQEVQEHAPETPPVEDKESVQAKNFRQLRQAAEQLKKERDEALARLQQTQNKPADDNFSLSPDDLVEAKHLSPIQQKIKSLEDQIKKYESQSSELAVETRLKYQYPDFDKVVNETTVNALREQYPELASTINTSTDLYSKAASAYMLIKRLGILPDREVLTDQKKAEENRLKPRSLASVNQSDSPLTKAHAFENGLTDELRAQLWK